VMLACRLQGLFGLGRDTGVEAGMQYFRPPACLAKNPLRIGLPKSVWAAIWGLSLNYGRSRSFSAMRPPSYYAAAGVANRVSVSR
jgi:hypothetical protein